MGGDPDAPQVERALAWLARAQQKKGHWGVIWQAYGTSYYAMSPILQVIASCQRDVQYDNVLRNAKEYLINSQRSDGSWYYELEGYPRRPSAVLQTALALQSCFCCGL